MSARPSAWSAPASTLIRRAWYGGRKGRRARRRLRAIELDLGVPQGVLLASLAGLRVTARIVVHGDHRP